MAKMRIPAKTSLVNDLSRFLLLIGLACWLLVLGSEQLGYHWQWYRIPRFFFRMDNNRIIMGPLLQGLAVTLKITAVSLGLAFLLGLSTAMLRMSRSFAGRALARTYLEVIRNTPLLIQLFFIYFVLSPVLNISAFASAVLALSLFEGAYASEIIRAGIVSIHKGQWEAAYDLGLSRRDTYRFVILPQALRRILPPLTSQAISLVKDSALVSTIAIYDLAMQAQAIVAETFLTFEIWFTVAGVYLCITLSLSLLVSFMRKRFAVEI